MLQPTIKCYLVMSYKMATVLLRKDDDIPTKMLHTKVSGDALRCVTKMLQTYKDVL